MLPDTETAMANSTLREEWLGKLAKAIAPKLVKLGHPLPSYRIACGFTSKGAKSNRIGECWSSSCSADAHHEIFIHPAMDDAMAVAGTLVHELIHAAVGLACQHKGDFKTVALAMGLEGKMTATTVGPAAIAYLEPMLKKLGPYPHAKLSSGGGMSSNPKRSSGKLIKASCPDCGYGIKIAKKWLDLCGLPECPACHVELLPG